MKSLIVCLLMLGFLKAGQAQPVPSNCVASVALTDHYTRDVRNLTLRRMFDLHSPDTALVRIPQVWQDTILGGLAAINNAVPIAERDSVFNLYCVHDLSSWQYSIYQELMVSVDTNYEWTQAWQNLEPLTGNPLIDTIIARYALEVTEFYNWSFASVALLATDSLWNIYALIDSLEMAEGVNYADPNYIIGTAGKIEYQKTGTDRYYDFWYQWNDCFDGCDNARAWKFKVYEDCSVEYLGSEDWWVFDYQPLPSPVYCNLFSGSEKNVPEPMFNVFPNPVFDRLKIEAENTGTTVYSLTDLAGRRVRTGSFTGHTLIDISNLPSGCYLLQLDEGNGHYYRKVLKQ
ncbi:MAG: T9SS type A sorting domain-containing protein [Bacteroidales bacterium]